MTVEFTEERFGAAHLALLSGSRDRALEYFVPEFRFLTPGSHPFAGWHEGIDNVQAFLKRWWSASGGTLKFTSTGLLVNQAAGQLIDVIHVEGKRTDAAAGSDSPYDVLNFDAVDHFFFDDEGRIVRGQAAMFGEGLLNFNLWWSPIDRDGRQRDRDWSY
jgi:uncharacterized protein